MLETDVLIIGGSASGMVAALTGKNNHPDKSFLLIRKEEKSLVPCGIPYIYGSLGNTDKNLMGDAALATLGINIKIGEVTSIDQNKKLCQTATGENIHFEKLILATGSVPIIPGKLKGANLKNVYTIPKSKTYHDQVLHHFKNMNKIIVIGGGFIGVEVADELNKIGKEITIVELLDHILGLVFDEEISIKAEELLTSRGVKIKTKTRVVEIQGEDSATGVLLENGEKIDADAVILSLGYRPNTEMLEKSGFKVNQMGRIRVDEYMRTENPDIFAIGDCAEKRDFITRKSSGVMLASTSCAEARVAGLNLYGLSSIKTFKGTIAIFSTAFGDTGFGAAGLTENVANGEGFDIVSGTFETVDKHPGTLAGAHSQMVKLIAARESGVILGGEVIGGPTTGEMTNIIGFMIQNMMTVDSIVVSQIGTHPLLTAAPTTYPIIKAAEIILKKIRHKA
jgi:pyruvate/2-oxoglutarate dehydrogenase complex dihydrolipoamide dehydrogenase (E3) component